MTRGLESMILGSLLNEALKDPTKRLERRKRPVAQDIATLKAAAIRYISPLSFKLGDLVTPRKDSPLKDAGRPHIVVDLDPNAMTYRTPVVHGDPNSASFGARRDMRVAVVCDCDHGEIVAHWVEAWQFEPYAEPAAMTFENEGA